MFEVDFAGWKSQNRGRDSWELVREALQNALDTGSDVEVTLDYTEKRIVVRDFDDQGIEDMSDLWTLFKGDKASDPEKRGRFGRGINEAIAGCEYAMVKSTAGTAEFFVDEERKEINEEETTDVGTEVTLQNGEWSNMDMDKCRGFLMKVWVPEDTQIDIHSLKSTTDQHIHRSDEDWDADYTFSCRLKTVMEEDGVMKEEKRYTDVEVKESGLEDSYLYEMGIPVTEIDTPYHINVLQKLPLTEMRNEVPDYYVNSVVGGFISNRMVELSDSEIEGWVTDWIPKVKKNSSIYFSRSTEREYANRRFGSDAVVGRGKVIKELSRHGFNTVNKDELDNQVASMVSNVAEDASKVWRQKKMSENSDVELTDDQQAVVEKIEDYILEPLAKEDVDIVLKEIESERQDMVKHAEYISPKKELRLNVKYEDWEHLSDDRVGTILHELAHDKGDGHDQDWWTEMERLAGKLIVEEVL